MNKLICLAACLLLWVMCLAQNIQMSFSNAYTGMGTYSRNSRDVFSVPANQAVLADMRETSGGIYSEQMYSMKELTLYSGVFIKPVTRGAIGISGRYRGGNNLQYLKLGIGYGKRLSDDIDIGLQFNYSTISVPAYGSSRTISADIGMLVMMTDRLTCGIHLAEVGARLLKKGTNSHPGSSYSFGLGYEASDKVLIKCDFSKQQNLPVLLIPGIQYDIKKNVFVRLAVIAETGTFIGGTGFKWRNIRTDVAASWHSRLGLTPSLLIILTPVNKSDNENETAST